MRKTYVPQFSDTSDVTMQESNPTTVRQFTCAILPNAADKDSEIAELYNSIGIENTSHLDRSMGNDSWQPLYIEEQTKKLPTFSHLLDEMWWKLPAKADTILSKELVI